MANVTERPANKQQPVNQQQSANEEIPENNTALVTRWQIKLLNFLIFLLVGVILMVASGVAVYFIFCIPPKPIPEQEYVVTPIITETSTALNTPPPVPDSPATSKDPSVMTTNSPLTPITTQTDILPTTTPTTTTTTTKTTTCKLVVPFRNCPGRPVCIDPAPCPTPAAVLCPPEPTLPCLPCPTDSSCVEVKCEVTCPPTPKSTTTKPPKTIELSRFELWYGNVMDLYRRYPINSYNRLQVVIQILEKGAEYYTKAFTTRNCFHDYKRICTYCTDRYAYLRCVMENDVQGSVYPRTTLKMESDDFEYEFRDRAYETANKGHYNSRKELREQDFVNRWSNHAAMSVWYERTADGSVSKDCQSCRLNANPVEHIECIMYKGWDKSFNGTIFKGFVN